MIPWHIPSLDKEDVVGSKNGLFMIEYNNFFFIDLVTRYDGVTIMSLAAIGRG
jgi:hypothetical protein